MSDTVNRKLLKGDSYTGLKETFRYGGMFTKDFTKTAKQRAEEHDTFVSQRGGIVDKNPYKTCACCGREFGEEEYPYAGFFNTDLSEKYSKLEIICKDCAYDISDIVIEYGGKRMNGKNSPESYEESEIAKFIKERFPVDCDWNGKNSYYFAVMLKEKFPAGKILYNLRTKAFCFCNEGIYTYSGKSNENYSRKDFLEYDEYSQKKGIKNKFME